VAVFGTQQSALEALLLKRRVMGPSWLALAQPVRVDAGVQARRSVLSRCPCLTSCPVYPPRGAGEPGRPWCQARAAAAIRAARRPCHKFWTCIACLTLP